MVEERYTYEEIGKSFGVSKQRIHQLLKDYSTNPWHGYKNHPIPNKYKSLLEKPCYECGSRKNLEVHHIDGNRNNNDLLNLNRLCRPHHIKAEKELFSNGTKKWNYTNRGKQRKEVSCQICGEKYWKKRSKIKTSKYNLCSAFCKGQWRNLV